MALVLADRVKETTTTTGTGTVTLLGASTGYQSFAAVGNGNTTYYCIAGQTGSEWEVGIGTYTSAGTTLARDTVLSSSNAGSLVNFSAGTKDVFVTLPSEVSVSTPSGPVITSTGTGAVVLGTSPTITTPVITANASQFTLQDVTDPTKQALFSVSGITTATTRTYTLPDVTGTVALLSGTQTFSGVTTFSAATTFSTTTGALNFGTSQSSGAFTVGGTSGTGTITLGRSTASQTTNIQAGATASGNTKTINFGTAGLSGSTTVINIGSTVSGATNSIVITGTVSGTNNIPAKSYVAAMNIIYGF